MARPVKFRIRDRIAIVTLAAPPANALAAPVRRALWDCFGRIAQHRDVDAVILIAEGRVFSGGTDLHELDAPETAPTLVDLCNRIEALPAPVVAGLHGAALAAGAALALACHYRVAATAASIGFPDVTLGLVPGGGATQRLPRLVGVGPALTLMLSGRAMNAEAARAAGLVDHVVSGHLHTGTWAHARKIVGRGPRPTRDRRGALGDGSLYLEAVSERRASVAQTYLLAPRRVVDCVEAALLLPFEAGLAFEAAAAEECRSRPQSAALRHVFMAEAAIDPRLMTGKGGRRILVDPGGTEVVSRLRHVFGAAAEALALSGHSREEIDGALVAFGFLRTPYGGTTPAAAPDATIPRRIVAALMAEGARQMAAGGVDRSADIDALAVHGLGFPRHRGGPMKAAEQIGLLALRREMMAWAADSALWAVPPLMNEAIKFADGFGALQPMPVARAG